MFNFRKIRKTTFDRETGKSAEVCYEIVAASLVSNEGYDEAPNGENVFEVDLEPISPEDAPIYGLTISIGNSGDWAQVQRDLDPEAKHETKLGTDELEMVDVLIEGGTLVIADSTTSPDTQHDLQKIAVEPDDDIAALTAKRDLLQEIAELQEQVGNIDIDELTAEQRLLQEISSLQEEGGNMNLDHLNEIRDTLQKIDDLQGK